MCLIFPKSFRHPEYPPPWDLHQIPALHLPTPLPSPFSVTSGGPGSPAQSVSCHPFIRLWPR